jgi:glutathione S-transferase
MYKLYTFSRSSTAWRARIALNLKNIKPEYLYLHLLKSEHRSDSYKKINPNMVVWFLFSERSFISVA